MKTKFPQKLIVLAVLFTLFISPVLATDYYVDDVNGVNTNSGLTPALAKKTIRAAASLTNPGDNVFVMNGTYLSSPSGDQSIVTITRSGTDGNYITYKPFPGHTPKLKLLAGLNYQVWRAVAINANYIVWDGIEIEGANASLDYAGAYQTWQDYENNIRDFNKISMYNCGSISIGTGATAVHHIVVRNCKISETGGGIGGFSCDYVTIENNLIFNTCWYSMYAGSGISILDPKSIDNVTGYKIFIRNNIVHNNKCLIPWERINALSDGNGIILDVNVGNGTTVAPYVGRYLVENNVSYNNGGGGVHAYKCAHVDIINNTAYNNGTVVGYPEIDANQCSDVKIYNNIMYARTGGNCNGNDANTIYDYNQYFNGPSFKNGPNDRTGDPLFVARSTTATANFKLQAASPAINNGSNTAGQFAPTDIVGVARPVGFASDKGAYEYPTVIARAEMKVSQGTAEILDNTGTFDFSDVSSTAPKTVTFTIDNLGDLALNLTGTPRVTLANTTGTGFSLAADAPATVSAAGSVTFGVTLSPTSAAGNYAGTISIANSDADENPYNFSITGYGYDGNKALQTITFASLPVKMSTDANFNPGAASSAGLPITYTSSNTAVATIVAGQIDLRGPGTTIITASQPGDATTNPARSVTQLLTVTPVLPPAGSNMLSNPTFDVNTTGWSFAFRLSGAATIASVPMTGSSTNVGKIVVSNLGTPTTNPPMDNVQIGTQVFLVKDRNYLISFKANADAPRNITLRLLMAASPFSTLHTVSNIPLTTTQSTFGTYAYTSTFTGFVDLRFWVGGLNIPVYFDDVTMIEEADVVLSPEMTVKQNGVEIADNTGTFSFGDATLGTSKTVTFTIENTGNSNLDFTGNPRVTVGGAGFSLVQDAVGNLAAGASTTFQVKFQPEAANAVSGTISIANNDPNENPFNFSITGTGVKKDQTITFADLSTITYGDAAPALDATSNSNLPITYSVVSGPATIITGNNLSYTGAGDVVLEATQTGDATYNAATPVQKTLTIKKKELVVTADDKTVTFGDPIPAFSYAITGFAFSETAGNLTGAPELSSTYTPTTPATVSPIIINVATGTLSAANYTFTLVNGEITIIPTPEINVKQASTDIAANTGNYNFGDITWGTSKTISFTIENTGLNTLNLTGSPRVVVSGTGFSLVADAPASIDAAGNATFEIKFAPDAVGSFNGTVSIANDDRDENPYTFNLSGTGIRADQTIAFNALTGIIYGDANPILSATSNAGLPVTYSIVSGPGIITTGNVLSYTGAGVITIEASQTGNSAYNAAAPVQQSLSINKKQLVVTADNKTVTYGDPLPAYTYTITGFVLGETTAAITGNPILSSTYTPTTPATESPVINVATGTLNSGNYTFINVNGQVNINHTFPLFLEAELADINGGSIVSIFPGYTGTGYVDHINKSFDYIQWTTNVSGAGMCTLKFRYALNNQSQNLTVTVNGTVVSTQVNFANTGNWRNWATVSVQAYLHAGINTIKINASGIAGPNMDNLTIESDIYTLPSQDVNVSKMVSTNTQSVTAEPAKFGDAMDITVYPVPAINDLKVLFAAKTNEKISILIFDMQGRIVYTKNFSPIKGANTFNIDISKIKSGSYLLKVHSSGTYKSKMIMIGK